MRSWAFCLRYMLALNMQRGDSDKNVTYGLSVANGSARGVVVACMNVGGMMAAEMPICWELSFWLRGVARGASTSSAA